MERPPKLFTSATHRGTTGRWFLPAHRRWFTAQAGTIRRTLAQPSGTGTPTLTELVQGLLGPISQAGASDSVSATATTILITTPGGDQWDITVVATIRTMERERGAEQ